MAYRIQQTQLGKFTLRATQAGPNDPRIDLGEFRSQVLAFEAARTHFADPNNLAAFEQGTIVRFWSGPCNRGQAGMRPLQHAHSHARTSCIPRVPRVRAPSTGHLW